MELELGVRITHNKDDITTDFRISKEQSNPLFMSKETESMFILTGKLKGYLRENIDIKINQEGNRLTISGKKAVQEMSMKGWIMQKKDVEIREFKKVFRIPDVINLDRIKAKFTGEETTLKITMPKLVKGMLGIQIEEVEEEVDKAQPEEVQEEIKEEVIEEVRPPEVEEVNKQEPEEVKKQEEPKEEEKPKKKKKSKGFHPSPPIVFAGSTSLLLAILLLLFNLLKSDRK